MRTITTALLCDRYQDDSAINCKVIAKLIESEKDGLFANAVILTADDGTTAVQTMKHLPHALNILKDHNICTFCRSIKGITGNVLAEDIHHFISNGANEVLSKPLTSG